jgi:hypothetical protein
LFIDASGRVGVGQGTPLQAFHVASSADTTIRIEDTTGSYTDINYNDSGTASALTLNVDAGNTGAGSFFRVNVDASERLRIDSSGRLGLGTSSPRTELNVFGVIEAGSATNSSVGSIILRSRRSDNNFNFINSIGAIRGSSATYVGFGVKPSTSANDTYVGGVNSTQGVSSLEANNGFLKFLTGASQAITEDNAVTLTERMRITSTGNVGIGTTSPGAALDVSGSVNLTGNLTFSTTTTPFITANAANSVLRFGTGSGGVERMRIDSSGRLLVGTSSNITNLGGFFLQTAGAVNTSSFLQATFSNATGGAIHRFYHSRSSTLNANTIVQDNDDLGAIEFFGADGTGAVMGARIRAVVDGSPGTDDMPGRLVFSVTADGASTPTEALRISNNRAITVSDGGNVVLGTTTGTKIGTATTQKLGFYNATPVVQPTAVADATDAATAISQLNALLAHMRTLGLIAT